MTVGVDVHGAARIAYGVSMRGRLLLAVWLLVGCEDTAPGGPRILEVTPDPVRPGELLVVRGDGFAARGHVGLGGRGVRAATWQETELEVLLPDGVGGGPLEVVVVAEGRPSAPYTIEVVGPRRAQRPPPRQRTGIDDARVDPGPIPDVGPIPDGAPPDVPRDLVAEFTPDGGGNSLVTLEALGSGPGELRLRVRPPANREGPAFGVAFHVTYDRNLLRFIELESPEADLRTMVKEVAPGQLAFGRVLPGEVDEYAVLRFGLVGRGVGRIDFPPRWRTVRDLENRPRPTGWAGGSVEVVQR